MATLETSPEANCDRQTGRQTDGMTKPLIGARATALPMNERWPKMIILLVLAQQRGSNPLRQRNCMKANCF